MGLVTYSLQAGRADVCLAGRYVVWLVEFARITTQRRVPTEQSGGEEGKESLQRASYYQTLLETVPSSVENLALIAAFLVLFL